MELPDPVETEIPHHPVRVTEFSQSPHVAFLPKPSPELHGHNAIEVQLQAVVPEESVQLQVGLQAPQQHAPYNVSHGQQMLPLKVIEARKNRSIDISPLYCNFSIYLTCCPFCDVIELDLLEPLCQTAEQPFWKIQCQWRGLKWLSCCPDTSSTTEHSNVKCSVSFSHGIVTPFPLTDIRQL